MNTEVMYLRDMGTTMRRSQFSFAEEVAAEARKRLNPSLSHMEDVIVETLPPLELRNEWGNQPGLVRQTTHNPPPAKEFKVTTWKAMHHPEWSAHPEEKAFISSGEYWAYYKNKHNMVLTGIRVGDKFCIEVKTSVGKRGPLKGNRSLGYMRRGTVTSLPIIASQSFDEKDWHVINIKWEDERYPLIDCNNRQQAIVKV